ncbi:unnamed protein product [Diplocarpon coronariae]|nr:hypothetical protein JHW43_000440 [Diplocarpon mali]
MVQEPEDAAFGSGEASQSVDRKSVQSGVSGRGYPVVLGIFHQGTKRKVKQEPLPRHDLVHQTYSDTIRKMHETTTGHAGFNDL